MQLLLRYVWLQHDVRQMLISATAHCSRFVGNSSVVTARGARATVATPTQWRLAWWTAARTLSSCAWITSKAAAAETSASTSIPRLTCKPGSRLRSTKPVKIQHLQPWWVHLCEVTGTSIFFSFFFVFFLIKNTHLRRSYNISCWFAK